MERDRIIEKEGKSIEEAIAAALAELHASEENVDIEVLDEGKKGFLGIGGRNVKIKVTEKFDPERFVKYFLEEVIRASNMEAEVRVEKTADNRIKSIIEGKDIGTLIGKRGATLDSLQYLVNLAVNKGNSPFMNVVIDTENYRDRRKTTLETLAKNLAKKVRSTRRPVKLEPMSSGERRIIHASLQDNPFVTTYSEGEEPFRNLVIAPSKKKPPKRETAEATTETASKPETPKPRGNNNNQRRNNKPKDDKANQPQKKETEEVKSTLFVSRPLDKRYFDNTRPFNPRPKRRENNEEESAANGDGKPPIKTYKNYYNKNGGKETSASESVDE